MAGATAPARHVVVMGVSGSGKSTAGALLADALGVPFAEGDSLHSEPARRTMAGGIPLTDEDRWPWLERLAGWMTAHADTGSVVSCSARHSYRELLCTAEGTVVFAHLDLPREELCHRLRSRTDHFMPASLLDSQLSTLEPLAPGEGITVDGTLPVEQIVEAILAGLS